MEQKKKIFTPEGIVQEMTGGKTKEEVEEDIKNKKWPFAISEEEMRKTVEEMGINKPEKKQEK